MKLILKKAHVYYYALMVLLVYFLFWPFFFYFSRMPSRYHRLAKLRGVWGLISSALAGFFYKFEYETTIDWSRTYIICPNHTSNLDISAMCIMVKNNHCFMGKEELLNGLVTGLFFRTIDIPVKRESNISSFRAFKKAEERLKNGVSMIIFPEGAIPPNYPPKMESFKNGPFRLAIAQKLPIIPVSSTNAWKMLWDDGTKYGTKPGLVDFYVHKPIETGSLTIEDADALRDKVFDIIKGKTEGKPHPALSTGEDSDAVFKPLYFEEGLGQGHPNQLPSQ